MTLYKQYLIELSNSIPNEVYEGLIIIFLISITIIMTTKGIKNSYPYIIRILSCEYIFLLLSSTIIFREKADERLFDFRPFRSYIAIQKGYGAYLPENIMNVIVFIPIGCLLFMMDRHIGFWKCIIIGALLSLLIESLQFLFMRGFSEVDDVLHNTLGCLLGYSVVRGMASLK